MLRTLRRLLHPIGVCDLTCFAILICAQTIRCSTRSTTCHLKSCKWIGVQTVHLWRERSGGAGGRAPPAPALFSPSRLLTPHLPNSARLQKTTQTDLYSQPAHTA